MEVLGAARQDGPILYYQREVYKAVKYGRMVDGRLETWYEYHHVPARG